MNALCAALIKTKMVGNKWEAKIMLESQQLLQDCNYKVGIAAAEREVQTTSIVFLDTCANP